MSDYFAEVERELRAATARRAKRPWMWRLAPRPVGLRLVLIVLAVVLATTTITLAATGVILVGSPVGLSSRPSATVGEGIPIAGASRLLPLRTPDPAGGLPWGMRVVHTTRGLVCVQIGRVQNGQLGQLGIDGAFANDGRFHPLPPDALPDVVQHSFVGFENCAEPNAVYAADVVGLQLSAASNPRAGVGPAADRREISFGLLGAHALSITYRSGSQTHSQPVLAKLGAYLIVQRYTSGRQLGSVSETDGSEQRYPYGFPTSPNGALSAITYRYGGTVCTDTGRNQVIHACGLSEAPPPRPKPLPSVHVPLRVPACPRACGHGCNDQLSRTLPRHQRQPGVFCLGNNLPRVWRGLFRRRRGTRGDREDLSRLSAARLVQSLGHDQGGIRPLLQRPRHPIDPRHGDHPHAARHPRPPASAPAVGRSQGLTPRSGRSVSRG